MPDHGTALGDQEAGLLRKTDLAAQLVISGVVIEAAQALSQATFLLR